MYCTVYRVAWHSERGRAGRRRVHLIGRESWRVMFITSCDFPALEGARHLFKLYIFTLHGWGREFTQCYLHGNEGVAVYIQTPLCIDYIVWFSWGEGNANYRSLLYVTKGQWIRDEVLVSQTLV